MAAIGQFEHSAVGPGAASSGKGDAAAVKNAIQTFAMVMAEEMLLGASGSQSQSIAQKLPGASENVVARMQTLREDAELATDRRKFGEMMNRKDEAINFRA